MGWRARCQGEDHGRHSVRVGWKIGDTMRIRRGKRKDFEALARIAAAHTPVSYRWYVKILKDLNHDLYVGEEEHRILGFSSVGYFKSIQDGGRRAVIEFLGLAHDASPEVAEKLLSHALQRVRKKGCRRVEASPVRIDGGLLRSLGMSEEVPVFSLFLEPKPEASVHKTRRGRARTRP